MKATIKLIEVCRDNRSNSTVFYASSFAIAAGCVTAEGRFHYMSPDSDMEFFTWPMSSILSIKRENATTKD